MCVLLPVLVVAKANTVRFSTHHTEQQLWLLAPRSHRRRVLSSISHRRLESSRALGQAPFPTLLLPRRVKGGLGGIATVRAWVPFRCSAGLLPHRNRNMRGARATEAPRARVLSRQANNCEALHRSSSNKRLRLRILGSMAPSAPSLPWAPHSWELFLSRPPSPSNPNRPSPSFLHSKVVRLRARPSRLR